MMAELLEHYHVRLGCNGGTREMTITLLCAENLTLNIMFHDPPLPANSFDPGTNTGTAHQPIDMYDRFLDLVRNEGPCKVIFNSTVSPPLFAVYSRFEKPAEGEL
jgi:hypothetical protein